MTPLGWPDLPYAAWKDTYETLHMWTQIVGKIRLTQMPWLNHTWQVTLYPTATGLSTGRMPHGGDAFLLLLSPRHRFACFLNGSQRLGLLLIRSNLDDPFRLKIIKVRE